MKTEQNNVERTITLVLALHRLASFFRSHDPNSLEGVAFNAFEASHVLAVVFGLTKEQIFDEYTAVILSSLSSKKTKS